MQDFSKKLISDKRNLWRYINFYPKPLSSEDQMHVESCFTPLEKSNYMEECELFLKREDKNETGSLKTRGLAYQLSIAKEEGFNDFVVSTSGNAGITAAIYLKKYGGNLIVITSNNIPQKKIDALKKSCKHLLLASNPTHIANYISLKYNFKNIRPSRDPNSIPGYYSLGFEVFEQNKGLFDNIFIYSSSGSSFIGLYKSFLILKEAGEINQIPKMFAVIRNTVKNFRHNEILKICEETGGQEILVTTEQFDNENFDTSYEGRSVLHAIRKLNPDGKTLAILTGSRYADIEEQTIQAAEIHNLQDVDNYMNSIINS